MELNKWYRLETDNEAYFIECAPKINREIVAWLAGRSFKVTALDSTDPNDVGVQAIQFADSPLHIQRIEALPHFKESDWASCWFYSEEQTYFTEVPSLEPKVDKEEYIIHVSGIEPKEYGGASGYMVGTSSWPQRFTLEAAKTHAELVLNGEGPNTKVHIFRLETIAKVVSQVNFE